MEKTPPLVCAHCGALMVRRYSGALLTSRPPQVQWDWWYACGHRADGGTERLAAETADDRARAEWIRINAPSDPRP